ncbi:MAG: nucleotidyltransferase domain-containing protein [Bacteroidales bacterium]|nr:nucleotidyltransferase domain-containing protein [Bacteroidales bacterium]
MINSKKILKELKSLLVSHFGDNITNVILFGSHANGTPSPYSDYDILVIIKNKGDWKYERKISEVCYEIDLKHDIITDIHIISEAELNGKRGQQPIFQDAISNGIYA